MKVQCIKMFICLVSVLLFSGCATTPSGSKDDGIVKERAQARLNALVAQDFKKAYSFASPGYRAGVSQVSHYPKFAGAANWIEAVVDKVDCVSDSCDVSTSVTYELKRLGLKNTRPMKQQWIKINGQWWIYHK